jgi:hypothetical protein
MDRRLEMHKVDLRQAGWSQGVDVEKAGDRLPALPLAKAVWSPAANGAELQGLQAPVSLVESCGPARTLSGDRVHVIVGGEGSPKVVTDTRTSHSDTTHRTHHLFECSTRSWFLR